MTTDATASAWKTAITAIEPNHVRVRGYDIGELMGRVSYGAAVYLILRGELPDDKTGRLMDALLVSSVDHGATPPSTLAARTVASTGGALGQSVAAGILSINRFHGGAIEDCATQLAEINRRRDEGGEPLEAAVRNTLGELKAQGRRMAGFGHRVHTDDPRTRRLFELAADAGVAGPNLEAAQAVQHAFEAAGRKLPINVDGAIAAVLADMGFEPATMNGLFMIARVPGLIAQSLEEQQRQRPMRKIDPTNHVYDGPPPRSI
ncbi:MAG: citryl-CoA lyase [Planctomycetota bacterium]|jgi:citrate synthase